jgi:hypothetical protein
MKISYNPLDNKLTIGNWRLTRLGTTLVELAGLVLVLALIGLAGGIELGTINL